MVERVKEHLSFTANILITAFSLLFFLSFFLLIFPDYAFSWGPGVHTLLTSSIDLASIGNAVSKICMKFYPQFLWGTILADMVIGKNFANWQYHPHNWEFVFSVFEKAKNDMQKAFMIGYMTHLAEDIIAHNFLIPDFILLESFLAEKKRKLRKNLIHFKIESVAENIPDAEIWKTIRYIQHLPENKECTEFLEENLKNPLFGSVKTSRRIFIQVLNLNGLKEIIKSKIKNGLNEELPRWEKNVMKKRNGKENEERERERDKEIEKENGYKRVSKDEVISVISIYVKEAQKRAYEFIKDFDRSVLNKFDPTGTEPIYISEALGNSVIKINEKKGEKLEPERFFTSLRNFQPPLMGKRTPVLLILKSS